MGGSLRNAATEIEQDQVAQIGQLFRVGQIRQPTKFRMEGWLVWGGFAMRKFEGSPEFARYPTS
jgi:hypothetical protein